MDIEPSASILFNEVLHAPNGNYFPSNATILNYPFLITIITVHVIHFART